MFVQRVLSPRRMSVYKLLMDGLSDKEIARRMGMSVSTVKSHAQYIYKQYTCHSRAELMAKHATSINTTPMVSLMALQEVREALVRIEQRVTALKNVIDVQIEDASHAYSQD